MTKTQFRPRPKFQSSGAPLLYWLVGAFIVLGGLYILMRGRNVAAKEGFADSAPEVTVTYYYLEQCMWCNKFKPEWEKFKAEAAKVGGIKTVEVDGEKNQAQVQEKGIKGFPSVWIEDSEYSGDRTSDELLKAVKAAAAQPKP